MLSIIAFFTGGIGRWVVLGLIVAASLLFVRSHFINEGRQQVQVEFDKFKNEVTATGLKAKQDAITKETNDAKRVAVAQSERDIAIERLRVASARPRGGFVSAPAAGSPDSGKVCYDRLALDAALRRLDTGVSAIVTEGDGQIINALSLLKAWPQ